MKRFGYYNNDLNNLFECYAQVSPELVVEKQLPSYTRQPTTVNRGGISFPGAKFCKVFVQQPSGGADLKYLGRVTSVESDDGEGNTFITSKQGDDTINIITSKQNAQVRVFDNTGAVEDEFTTTLPARYDSNTNEIIIIQTELL
jgi:hypothetical protein